MVKNPPANAGDAKDTNSIPGSGRSPGEGNGNPLQYSCLDNPMDRGAWRATVLGIAKSQTRLKQLSTQHTHMGSKVGFPGGSDSKKICLQWRRPAFNPWVWRRKWQPLPVSLPRGFHGQRSPAGDSP